MTTVKVLLAFAVLVAVAGCTTAPNDPNDIYDNLLSQNPNEFGVTYDVQAPELPVDAKVTLIITKDDDKYSAELIEEASGQTRKTTFYDTSTRLLECRPNTAVSAQRSCYDTEKIEFIDVIGKREFLERNNLQELTYIGTESIAGRTCKKYNVNLIEFKLYDFQTYPGVQYSVAVCLDEKTGIPLSYEIAGEGNFGGSQTMSFTATSYESKVEKISTQTEQPFKVPVGSCTVDGVHQVIDPLEDIDGIMELTINPGTSTEQKESVEVNKQANERFLLSIMFPDTTLTSTTMYQICLRDFCYSTSQCYVRTNPQEIECLKYGADEAACTASGCSYYERTGWCRPNDTE